MSIKKAVIEKNDGNEVEKSEYVNLILDDMTIAEGRICDEDREFLEGFTETLYLSLNSTGLKSLQNLPKMPKLERLELCDNKLGCHSGIPTDGTPLFNNMNELYPNLKVLKLSNNQIKTFDDLKPLSLCEKLENLDLTNNPVSQKPNEEGASNDSAANPVDEEYAKKLREVLP